MALDTGIHAGMTTLKHTLSFPRSSVGMQYQTLQRRLYHKSMSIKPSNPA